MEKQDIKTTPKKTITIDVPSDIEKGAYANQIIIGHSQKEFIMDFGLIVPPGNKIKITSRVITNPIDAKAMLMVLNENISRYEKVFGTINVPHIKLNAEDHHLH
ncbi:DUF3467 domain-containing protein [bacterium]|nr:DUF3467 domain-containing protein [bacterium]